MADALARHVLDHAPPEAREHGFATLCERFPEALATWQCARTLVDESEHPSLVGRARAFLGNHARKA
jgi:hypothetical protein